MSAPKAERLLKITSAIDFAGEALADTSDEPQRGTLQGALAHLNNAYAMVVAEPDDSPTEEIPVVEKQEGVQPGGIMAPRTVEGQ